MLGRNHQDVVVVEIPGGLGTVVAESDQGLNNFEMAMSGSHHQGRVTRRGLGLAELLDAVEFGGDSVDEFKVAFSAGGHETLGLLFNHD